MKIPFLSFKSELKFIGKDINIAVRQVINSGSYVLGTSVEKFENAFANWIGVKYAVGVGSGTEALHLSLLAGGVKPGDEVITVTNTCGPTISAIMACGAMPVLVDADPFSYCINVSEVEKKITKKTRAIVPVHLYGQTAEMEKLMEISRNYSIPIIEDCAQAHGAKYKNMNAGSIGLLGCFSFYPTKNLGTIGDAGMITTNSKDLAEKCRLLRNYGQRDRYIHELAGFNSRLDELHAAVLNVKLKRLTEWNERRREIAKKYNDGLDSSKIFIPREMDYAYHIYHLYVIRVKSRELFQQNLQSRGISTLIHYPVPMHRQKFYTKIVGNNDRYPVADEFAKQVISLPMHPYLKNEEVDYIINAVNNA